MSHRNKENKLSKIFKTIFEESDDAVYAKDLDGRYLLMNSAAMDYLSTTKEVLGRTDLDRLPKEIALRTMKEEEDLIKAEKRRRFEETKDINGRERSFLTTKTPLRDEQGNVIGLICIAKDVTEEKLEKKLRKKSERLRTVITSAPLILAVTDKDGIITTSIGKALKALEKKWGENVGKSIFEVFRDNDPALKAFRSALKGEECEEVLEFSVGDRLRIFETVFSPAFDERGMISGVIVVATDITKRKKAQEKLRLSEEKFAKAFRASPDAITISTLKDGNIIDLNEKFSSMTGFSREEAIGKTTVELGLIDSRERDSLVKILQAESHVRDMELSVQTKSGDLSYVLLTAEPIQINSRPHLITIARDITGRKHLEEVLSNLATRFASTYGTEFFNRVCAHVCEVMDVDYAFIGRLMPDQRRVRIISGIGEGKELESQEYDLPGTPCDQVIGKEACVYQSKVQELFPDDQLLKDMKAEGYAGIPLFARSGEQLGIFTILSKRPIKDEQLALSVMSGYSARVAAEIERTQAEAELRQKDRDIRKAYVDVFSAVTDEKLLILTPEEIPSALGEPHGDSYSISSFKQLADSRNFLREKLQSLEISKDLLDSLILASGEAVVNGVKHAGACEMQVCSHKGTIQIKVSDHGPRIDFSDLPKATLLPGFSTQKSLGMGFGLILYSCDRVLISTGPEGTTLILEVGGTKERNALDSVLSRGLLKDKAV